MQYVIYIQCSSELSFFKFATTMMVEATCSLLSASVFVVVKNFYSTSDVINDVL